MSVKIFFLFFFRKRSSDSERLLDNAHKNEKCYNQISSKADLFGNDFAYSSSRQAV